MQPNLENNEPLTEIGGMSTGVLEANRLVDYARAARDDSKFDQSSEALARADRDFKMYNAEIAARAQTDPLDNFDIKTNL